MRAESCATGESAKVNPARVDNVLFDQAGGESIDERHVVGLVSGGGFTGQWTAGHVPRPPRGPLRQQSKRNTGLGNDHDRAERSERPRVGNRHMLLGRQAAAVQINDRRNCGRIYPAGLDHHVAAIHVQDPNLICARDEAFNVRQRMHHRLAIGCLAGR
jgi:hypothetical protein